MILLYFIKTNARPRVRFWALVMAAAVFFITCGSAWGVSLRFKLEMLGYHDEEIRAILSGKLSMTEVNSRIRRKMMCLPETASPDGNTPAKEMAAFGAKGPHPASQGSGKNARGLLPGSEIAPPIPEKHSNVGLSHFKLDDTPYLPKRARQLLPIIQDAAEKTSLDESLLMAVIKVESDFEAQAMSPKGAIGLMQLLPSTARRLGLEDPFNPKQNIHGGARYLAQCIDTFQDMGLALAAYNAGPYVVKRLQAIPPYPETQQYVKNVSYYKTLYENLSTHPIGRGSEDRFESLDMEDLKP